ncbi:MAG: hypothetical protein C4291_03035 [Candidatus Dadabacteria bacterium]
MKLFNLIQCAIMIPTLVSLFGYSMVVTGHETVYEWRCNNGMPEIVRESTQPDARGFLSNIWYEISPN